MSTPIGCLMSLVVQCISLAGSLQVKLFVLSYKSFRVLIVAESKYIGHYFLLDADLVYISRYAKVDPRPLGPPVLLHLFHVYDFGNEKKK
jgi:hypothetical protein